MKIFKDLKFVFISPNPSAPKRATMFFENGYGVSVLKIPHFKGRYELGVVAGSEETWWMAWDNPIVPDGTADDIKASTVSKIMVCLQALDPIESPKI